ncbi:GlxA family transcriptional regulator [Duganella sp. SG902]|uniref:GlxA family transcriptional regulator n=1 Tax=Duganella sp. SG902 TaxID=2587016 RepID=UPI00159D9034|nr:GlxA family transcriptional regulator [Duganella sp. SG902]
MHRLGFFLTDEFQVMALGTQSVFEFANVVAREKVYQVTNYSLNGGELQTSQGITIKTQAVGDGNEADSWLVSGVVDPMGRSASDEELDFIAHAAKKSRRTVGLCTGAFVLGDAGLLDGRRATTHWAYVEALKARHPRARIVVDHLYVVDGPIWTSAGLTAAMDLALGMVERDLGQAIATRVAQVMVMDNRRSGGQSQLSEMLKLAPKSDRVQKALEYARQNLSQPLRVDDLAKAINLSPRQFGRIFQAETGQSPAKAIEQLRLEAARTMIERGRHPLEVIARETGFRDRSHLREVFVREIGVSPQSLRRDARAVGTEGQDGP